MKAKRQAEVVLNSGRIVDGFGGHVRTSSIWAIGASTFGAGGSTFGIANDAAQKNLFVVQSSGNVGIGTTVPSTTLQVAGSSTIRIGAGNIPGCLELMDSGRKPNDQLCHGQWRCSFGHHYKAERMPIA